jgi:ElaA protein
LVKVAAFAELDPRTLYALLRLRVDVFVVEQHCPYPEVDGRDTEAATRHLWVEENGEPVAYLRLLDDPAGHRIGRVVTRADARHRGLAADLMRAALDLAPGTIVLDAQSYLVEWYRGFGFEPDGPEYVEDGIPHTPMRRELLK